MSFLIKESNEPKSGNELMSGIHFCRIADSYVDTVAESLIAEYCGNKTADAIRKNMHNFQTEGVWNDYGITPPYEYKVLIELLHLAYTGGGSD